MTRPTNTADDSEERRPQQLTLFVTFHIDPARIEEWRAAHRPVWAAVAAEPRCVLFDVFEDVAHPGTLRMVEVWGQGATRHWFETVQLKKPCYEELWPKSRATWTAEPEIEYFERMRSEGGGSDTGPAIYRKGYLDGARKMEES